MEGNRTRPALAERERLAGVTVGRKLSRAGRGPNRAEKRSPQTLLTTISVLLVLTTLGQAQSFAEFLRAPSLEWAELTSPAPKSAAELFYQSGFQLRWRALDEPSRSHRLQLPRSTVLWDRLSIPKLGDFVVAVGSKGVFLSTRRGQSEPSKWAKLSPATDLFRDQLDSAARRKNFLGACRQSDGSFLLGVAVHGLEKLTLLEIDIQTGALLRRREVAAPVASEQSFGWGLGYRMSVHLRPPEILLDRRAESDELSCWVRASDRWRLIGSKGERFSVRDGTAAPAKEDHQLLEFPRPLPALRSDLNGDGSEDLVSFDPGTGTLVLTRNPNRAPKSAADEVAQPDQVLRLGGWLLARWLVDVDGDGRRDLATVTVPELNMLQQYGVLATKSATFRFSVRRLTKSGLFEENATLEKVGQIAVDIVITRRDRQLRFRQPIRLLRQDGALKLLAPAEGGLRIHGMNDGDGDWAVESSCELKLAEGEVLLDPFGSALKIDSQPLVRTARGTRLQRILILKP